MKSCELCMMPATTYCESDQAFLCWDCDARVHGANFLVARHVRCLLCHTCHSPTPWRASGFNLDRHTASVCDMCVNGDDREESTADNEEEEEEGESDSSDDVVEEADNQVVPWCSISNTPPSVSGSSNTGEVSSSSGECELSESNNISSSSKRLRANASEIDRLSTKRRYGDRTHSATRSGPKEQVISVGSTRISEDRRD